MKYAWSVLARSPLEWARLNRLGLLDVLFYASEPADEVWMRSTYQACKRRGWKTAMVLSHGFRSNAALPGGWYAIETPWLKHCRARIVVTSSSGVPRDVMPDAAKKVHMPHSLISLHMVYYEDAFDGYDWLFAAGPHHVAEAHAMRKVRGKGPLPLPTGYGKFDVFPSPQLKVGLANEVLLAPSWGEKGLLETCGFELVVALLEAGWRVCLRPHPVTLRTRPDLIRRIVTAHASNEFFCFESPAAGDQSLFRADFMISDYSGVAMEYGFLRHRPILFVDVPKKERNPRWRECGLEPMEVACRERLGTIVPPDPDRVTDGLEKLRGSNANWSERILAVRSELVANYGQCGESAAQHLETWAGPR